MGLQAWTAPGARGRRVSGVALPAAATIRAATRAVAPGTRAAALARTAATGLAKLVRFLASAHSARCVAITAARRAPRRRLIVWARVSMAFSRCCSRATGVQSANAFRLRNAVAMPTARTAKPATEERSVKMPVVVRRAASATAAAGLVVKAADPTCVWPSAVAVASHVSRRATPPRASATARGGSAKIRQEAPQSPPVPKPVLPVDSQPPAREKLLVAGTLHRGANVHDLIAIRRG